MTILHLKAYLKHGENKTAYFADSLTTGKQIKQQYGIIIKLLMKLHHFLFTG